MKKFCTSRLTLSSIAALTVWLCVVPSDVGSQSPPPTAPTAEQLADELALKAGLQRSLAAAVGELRDAGDAIKAQWRSANAERRAALASAYNAKLSSVAQQLKSIPRDPENNIMEGVVAGQYEVAVKAIDVDVRGVAGTALAPSPYATAAERAERFGLAPAKEELTLEAMQVLALAERDPARYPLQNLICTPESLKSVLGNASTGATAFAETTCVSGRPTRAISSPLADVGLTCQAFEIPKEELQGDGRYSVFSTPNGSIQIFRPRGTIFFMASGMAMTRTGVDSRQGQGLCRAP